MPPHTFKIRRPRLPDPLPPDETPYVPDTAPVVETRSGVMSRVWLEWARRVTGLAAHGAAGTGGGAPDPHAPTHEPGGTDPMAVDAAPGVGSLRTLGPGANQAAPGNDARFTAPSTPTAHHATHEPGGADPMAVDAIAAIGSLRTLGTGANQAAAGNDSRLTNARTPTAHATTHQPGGADAMAVDAAAATGSLRTLGTGSTQAAPGNDARFTAAPQAHHASHEPGGGDALVNVAWTNIANVFTQHQTITRTNARVNLRDTSQASGTQTIGFASAFQTLNIGAYSDDGITNLFQMLTIDRVGNVKASGDIYEKQRAAPMGHWIDVAYSAANFSGSGSMTWTVDAGDVVTFAYFLVGKTITVNMFIQTTSVGGTRDSYLMVNVPGFVSTRGVDSVTKINDNGTQLAGLIRIFPGESLIRFHKIDSTVWSAASNTTAVYAQFSYPIA